MFQEYSVGPNAQIPTLQNTAIAPHLMESRLYDII